MTAPWLLSFIKGVPTYSIHVSNDEFKLKFEFLHFQVKYAPSGLGKSFSVLCPTSPDQEKCLFYLEERTLGVGTAAALEKSAGAPGLLQPSPPYLFPSLHRRRHPALQSQENRLLEKLRMYQARPRRNILRRPLLDSLSFSVSGLSDPLWLVSIRTRIQFYLYAGRSPGVAVTLKSFTFSSFFRQILYNFLSQKANCNLLKVGNGRKRIYKKIF